MKNFRIIFLMSIITAILGVIFKLNNLKLIGDLLLISSSCLLIVFVYKRYLKK